LSAGSSCSGDDVALRLSSTTNAHAEAGHLGNYGNKICLSNTLNFVCSYSEGVDCDPYVDGYRILRLSNITNAHIDGSNLDYNNYVCCRESSCEFNNVAISFVGQANEGDSVEISFSHSSNCGSASAIFIYANSADGSCIVTPGGDMEGIFGSLSIPDVAGSGTVGWTVPPIHPDCTGKTVHADTAIIYDGGTVVANPIPSGSVEFYGALPPGVCGDGNLDTPNLDGVDEVCEFLNPYNFDPLSDPFTCDAQIGGHDLIDCSYNIPGEDDCGACFYDPGLPPPPPGQFSYIEYGDCIDTPPEGDGFGEMDETIIVRWDNGTLISSTTSSIECQILNENVPFFDWVNFMIVFLLIGGYYFVGKRKLL
jgi:hypothetical protein